MKNAMIESESEYFLKEVDIKATKGFAAKESLSFAVPNNLPGSGLTIMIGQEKTGKTSVIQSLRQKELKGASKPNLIYMPALINVQKRRPPDETKGAINNFKHAQDEAAKYHLLFDALAEVWHNDSYKTEFNRLLEKILPGFTWSLDEPRSAESSFGLESKDMPPPGFLECGGIMPFFYACLHLIDTKEEKSAAKTRGGANNLLLLDEPEAFLPEFGYEGLMELIAEITKKRQVIISTTAPTSIRWQNYINGSHIMIFSQDEKGNPVFEQLRPTGVYSSITDKTGTKWQKPQVIDNIAGKMLMVRKVVLLEKEEFLTPFKQWLAENNQEHALGPVIAFETDDPAKMRFMLAMAADLKTEKVAALYGTEPKSLKFMEGDRTRFSKDSSWQFLTMPEQNKSFLSSLLGKKSTAAQEDLDKTMSEVVKYFSQKSTSQK